MNSRIFFFALLNILSLTVPATSSANGMYQSAEIEAYCQVQRTEAALKSDAAMRPGFFSEYTSRNVVDAELEYKNSNQRYLRAGVELELHNIRRALKIRDLGEARCQYYQQYQSFSASEERNEAEIEKKSLAAKVESLSHSIKIFQSDLDVSRERLKSRAETLQGVEDSSARLTQLKLKLATAEGDLALAQARSPDNKQSPAAEAAPQSDLANVGLAEIKVDSLQTDLGARDYWELTLGGGTERIWNDRQDNVSRSGKPYYVALTLRYNLLAPFYIFRKSAYNDALENWSTTNPRNAAQIAKDAAEKNKLRTTTATELIRILTERKTAIDEVITKIGKGPAKDVSSFIGRLAYELAEIKAELAYLQTKVILIKQTATPKSTAGKNAESPQKKPTAVDVTLGEVDQMADGSYIAESSKLRARSLISTGETITAEFFYQGKTDDRQPLGGGEERDQFGVYLNAKNQCNLLYVMVRLAAQPVVVIQKKINANQQEHEECGNQGYSTIASKNIDPALIEDKTKPFILAASSSNGTLVVQLNGVELWTGSVPTADLGNPGYSGLRSDNAKIKFKILK